MPSIVRRLTRLSSILLAMSLLAAAAQSAESGADAEFVGNVSQGGRYEVEASMLALRRASTADVQDLATAEIHDHERVNAKLKKITMAAGIPVAPTLNTMFQQRLATLRAAADFDTAYIEDMKQIHDKDEKLFAKEAIEGTGAFKPFASETDLIVRRHIGALHGTD